MGLKRNKGERFSYEGTVYRCKGSDENEPHPKNGYCVYCSLLYKCIRSKPVRGACVHEGGSVYFNSCNFWQSIVFRLREFFGKE